VPLLAVIDPLLDLFALPPNCVAQVDRTGELVRLKPAIDCRSAKADNAHDLAYRQKA
jgi:hypothetical protein